MNDRLMADLFPWPEDRPLRRARFGKGPAKGEPLPTRHPDHVRVAAGPWSRKWEDEELGLWAEVRADPESGEVRASVGSPRTDYLGKAVSVGLVGEKEDQLLRVTVPLNEREMPGSDGCRGFTVLGSLDELRARVGPNPELAVFLLE